MWDPTSIANLQVAAKTNNQDAYWAFAKHANEHATRNATFRGLFRFKHDPDAAVPLDSVEPASEIVKRFCTGAMSFGSISAESHEALAVAMNRMGGKSVYILGQIPIYLHLIFQISNSQNWFSILIFEFDFLSISNWILQATQAMKFKFEIERKKIKLKSSWKINFVK